MRHLLQICTVATVAIAAGVAQADTVNNTLAGKSMFGIGSSNGSLVLYDFDKASSKNVGTVKIGTSTTCTGIQAAAYFPGFQNIFALWNNPSDGKNKLLYVNAGDASATVVASDVEGGTFTGAAGINTQTSPFTVFAIQKAKIKPPQAISGSANINPNNSTDNEFSLTKGDGSKITRDNLQKATVDAYGTLYQGAATALHLKPKGNGNQNGLIINGAAYPLQNSNTYDFSGDMQVRLYNDKVNGNLTASGHWWIEVTGTVVINGAVQIETPSRVTKIDQKTGTVTELMVLSQDFVGLATTDGKVFFTTGNNGKDLYKIDLNTLTVTMIGTMTVGQVSSMQLLGEYLMAYDAGNMALAPTNPGNGQPAGSQSGLGLGALGAIMFTNSGQNPTSALNPLYD